ncbi:MAG: ice-binding family protein, partial [Saprospiraceae bacterium]
MNVIATDNCGGSTSVVFVNDVISNQACLNRFIVTRTYRATDACGNSATCSRTITVSDFTPPSITCPQNVTVQCANLVPPANIGLVTASDNCNGAATVSFLGDVISGQTCVNRYTIARTYRAIDECGNSASCTQTITVFDNTPPSIVCPANTTVQCASLVPGPDTTTVTASDNCGGGATVTFLNDFISNQTCANRFTVTRTYRETDACGNSATCTQILTVFDNTPPTITCPNDVTVECAALVPVADVASVVASDNCGGAVTVTLDGEVGSNQTCINGYTITRTYRATDACGNSATCTQTIVVRDQTPPEVMCPASVTVQCASEIPVADPSTVSVSDNCGENATVRFVNDVISNQSCVNRFTVTRTYQAIDNCGNSASCIQIITVNDTTPPVITCPANLTIQNGSSTTPTMSGPNSSVVNLGTASTFALFTASGAFNNVGASFVVGDIGTNVGAFSGFPPGLVIGQIHVADAVSATAATDVAAAYGFLSGVSCDSTIGTTLGNNQILPPHIYCLGAASNLNGNLILDGKGDPNAVFIFKIDGALSTTSFSNISLIDSASACNVFWQINGAVALGDHSVFRGTILTSGAISLATAAVLDGSGLSTSGAVSTSTDIVALCASGNAVPAIATATDNCDQSPLVTFNDVTIAGNCQDEYEIQRTWTATDACNNSATCLQTIEVAGSCGVDLALTKDLDPGQAVVAGGDNVNFTITVTNQGVVTISSLTITDYIPLGFSLNDPDWLPGTAGSTGQSASIVLSIMNGGLGAGGLLPGGSVSVGITLQADANIHSGIYNNLAEISQEIDINGLDVSNSDIDSNADNNDTNDAPGEDDIDAAPICVVNPIITGPVFVCGGDTTIYGLEFFNTTSLYTFLLANGGTIISTTDSTATVVWQLTPGGPFTIKVTEVASPGCVGMDSLKVIIRGSDPIACIDHLNLSIDNACGTVVHSGMILVGEAPGDTNYTVIIRDQNGNIIPNATFTYEHVGQTFNVMVLS